MEGKKRELHPAWFFAILSLIVIVLSFILSLLNFQGTATEVSSTLKTATSVMTVESLLSADGLKFIFGECLNNFLKFMPLGALIMGLASVGAGIKVGLFKSIFSKIAKVIPRKTAFFIFSLLCIIMGFSTDLSFVIMVPVAALLFTEYKRSQIIGMTMAFVSSAAVSNINLFITSLDYSLAELSKSAINVVDSDYVYSYSGNLFFIVISSLLLALLISIITDILARTKPVRIGEEEIEISARADKKGLRKSLIALGIIAIFFIYSIIPGLPLSGSLLDNTQDLYINKLFGANSPFVSGILYIVSLAIIICSIVYGITTKQVKDDKDVIKLFTNSLNGIGEMLVLVFFASQFVALFKYTNIGNVITVNLFNLVKTMDLSFIVLMIVSFLVILISSLFVTSISTKWTYFAPTLIPLFMKSNITPEFTGALFRLASSATNIITPVFSYFVVFVAFIGLYSKNDFNIKKCYKLLMPYFIAVTVLWLFIVIAWYALGAPIGPNVYPVV